MCSKPDDYDAAADAKASYFAAIEAKRLRGDKHWTRKPEPAMAFAYIYRWDRMGRKDQRCNVTARGARNSCRVEFEDGHIAITSRNALRRA